MATRPNERKGETILRVPFRTQTEDLDCGLAALVMCCEFLDPSRNDERALRDHLQQQPTSAVSTLSLTVAAAKLGFTATLYTNHITFNPSNFNHSFYQKHGGGSLAAAVAETRKRILQATATGARLVQQTLSLDELLALLSPKRMLIVLLDWNVVTGRSQRGYWGHFVPLVGYDHVHVVVHNQASDAPQPFLRIERDVFDAARLADGTDQDVCALSL